MIDGGIFLFDIAPHEFTRRRRWKSGETRGRGEPLVPEATLCRVWAILGSSIELVERDGVRGE